MSFSVSFADENVNQNKISLPTAQENSLPPGDNDPDSLITNKKLRAESGSTSKYSVATEFDYNGGSLHKPLDSRRPNISDGAELTQFTGVEGYVSGKWNMNKTESWFLGVGVRAVTPFTSNVPDGAGDRFNASNPSLIYQKLSRLLGMQSVFNLGPTFDTSRDIRATGTLGNMQMIEALAYDFNGSRYSVGGDIILTYRFFDKGTDSLCTVDDEEGACGANQSDYSAGVNPFFEYEINDNFSFRTVLGLFMYDHQRPESRPFTMSRNVVYQSVGFGISLTRDLYMFPNVQFIPGDMRADKTNVALMTLLNLF